MGVAILNRGVIMLEMGCAKLVMVQPSHRDGLGSIKDGVRLDWTKLGTEIEPSQAGNVWQC